MFPIQAHRLSAGSTSGLGTSGFSLRFRDLDARSKFTGGVYDSLVLALWTLITNSNNVNKRNNMIKIQKQ